MNLFKPVFKEETFDVVICNGVLHHTSDPLLGFESISKLVKKGGYIIIGLYNKYGRIFTDIRRSVFTISNENFKSLDSRVRDDISDKKKHTWYMDQYKNPHESKHTVDEVLSWFENNGFEYNEVHNPNYYYPGWIARDNIKYPFNNKKQSGEYYNLNKATPTN